MKKYLLIIRDVIKKCWFNNPYILYKRKKYINECRSRFLYSNNPSIICSTCIGGIIYHNLGLKFLSPTINLWMRNSDFIKLIGDLEGYMSAELLFKSMEEGYPIGMLKDITIHFNHYKTFEEARLKWNERKYRINYDNLYIIMGDEGINHEELKKLSSIRCKKLVVFTAKKYEDFAYTYQLKRYQNKKSVGMYVLRDLDGFREFEKSFDYVSWLNQE